MTTHPLKTVGILSPGDMGHAVGQRLGEHGLRVITCLQGRSERTRNLAGQAQISDVGTVEALVREADIILSILGPDQAGAAVEAVAAALGQSRAGLLYADCNAIAPQTTIELGRTITAAGGRFVDASIIGPPPKQAGTTRFYASGPEVASLAQLNDFGLQIIALGDEIGQASALKMCYAAMTKGFTALCTELLTAAEALGVSAALHDEFQLSQSASLQRMERGIPGMPAKSRRWVGEMEEIAKTFAQVGLPPQILAGAAELYRFVGSTPLAERTPEDPSPLPSLTETISILAEHLTHA